MEGELLKIITGSGGGVTSAIIVYLMFTIKKELHQISIQLIKVTQEQAHIREKCSRLDERMTTQNNVCNKNHYVK